MWGCMRIETKSSNIMQSLEVLRGKSEKQQAIETVS